jgi:hypothetical protein
VYPLVPRTKIPIKGTHGFHSATTNPETIRRYWRVPDRNIGLATGMASDVWVLDIDSEDGEVALRAFEETHGPLPPTCEVITARGRHIWFKCTTAIRCIPLGVIAPGLEVRGAGGGVLVPPSIHPTGRRYEFSVDSVDTLAHAPPWLLDLARKRPTISERALAAARPPINGAPGAYGRAALDGEIAELAGTARGNRNHQLFKAAATLFQLVAGGELDEREVFDRLIAACHANGLMSDPDDGPIRCQKTIQSGLRAGRQNPRARP